MPEVWVHTIKKRPVEFLFTPGSSLAAGGVQESYFTISPEGTSLPDYVASYALASVPYVRSGKA